MSDTTSHFPPPRQNLSDLVPQRGLYPTQPVGNGEVQHINLLSEHFGALYLNEDFSDVLLKVEDEKFPAHRIVLAARSEYFRAMFYGGMVEKNMSEVELLETQTSTVAFKILLRYIYTSKMSLNGMKEELVIDLLGLAHKYGFSELETSIAEYLKAILNNANMCSIFNISQLYSLESLTDFCLSFADKNAREILGTQGFLQLSSAAVHQLISRDSFCASEIEIFRAIEEWFVAHPQASSSTNLLSLVRFPLISLEDLLNVVRPTGLVTSDSILDAIKEQKEKRTTDLTHRGVLIHNINVVTSALGAAVISGEGSNSLLSGADAHYEGDRSYTRHQITGSPQKEGITIELHNPYIINRIFLQLWDREPRMYSYYIEVSMDRIDWVRIVDHSQYLCRSKQTLQFPARSVKFIRIVGTHSSVSRIFHLVAMEAMFTTEPFTVDSETTLIVPTTNVATIGNKASVIEGVSRSRNALINGETTNYDWDMGYTCHQIGSGAITIQLPQPYLIGSMSLLLWDCDTRSYSYFVEVSVNQQTWIRVADKTAEACQAWQHLQFAPVPMVFIRIVGTQNTANEVFHVVHFECPARSTSSALNLPSSSLNLPSSHTLSVESGPSTSQVQPDISGLERSSDEDDSEVVAGPSGGVFGQQPDNLNLLRSFSNPRLQGGHVNQQRSSSQQQNNQFHQPINNRDNNRNQSQSVPPIAVILPERSDRPPSN